MKSKSFKISHTFCEIEKLVDVAQPKFVGTLNCPVKCRWVVEQSSWRWSSASHSRTSWRKCRGWGSQKSESRCKLEHDFVEYWSWIVWLCGLLCFPLSVSVWFICGQFMLPPIEPTQRSLVKTVGVLIIWHLYYLPTYYIEVRYLQLCSSFLSFLCWECLVGQATSSSYL